jgi:excisionase family DNA binding protein
MSAVAAPAPAVAPPVPLRTPEQVAEILSVTVQTLAHWRSTGRVKLPFIKFGGTVRYEQSAIDEFLASRRVSHTGEVS